MPNQTRVLAPGPKVGTLLTPDGKLLEPPAGWALLPPGDPGLTRRVKSLGPSWTVQEKKGRKLFSRGVYAPAERIAAVKAALAVERADPRYAQKLAAAARRRDEEQRSYIADFEAAVLAFLAFHPRHAALAERLARAVTLHATPVGSGTVARTERIPLPERAEAAVIAWLRHQTTDYDDMAIARVKGLRREVRRELAQRSRRRLDSYRQGLAIDGACPLAKALSKADRA